MADAKRRLRNLTVKEVSLVTAGDNPPAKTILFKSLHRDEDKPSGRRRRRRKGGEFVDTVLALVASELGEEPDEAFAKRLFDEVREDSRRFEVENVLMNRIQDLSTSVIEALFPFDDDAGDPQALVKASLEQFASAMDEELAEIFAGRIVKGLDLEGDAPDQAAIEKLILASIDREPQAKAGTTQEVEGMDLSKLTKKDREAVEKAIEDAKGVTGLQEQIVELKKVTTKKADDKPADPLEALPEEVRKIVDPLVKAATERADAAGKVNVALLKRLETIEASAARNTFDKSVGDLTGLPEKRDEIVERLYKMTNVEDRDAMLKVLEASAEMARRGALGNELGSGYTDGGSAYAKIESFAKELQKADPKLTIELAKVKAMEQNPQLYDEYLAEESVN